MKVLQIFTDEYLAQVRDAEPSAILEYIENFRLMQEATVFVYSRSAENRPVKIPSSQAMEWPGR